MMLWVLIRSTLLSTNIFLVEKKNIYMYLDIII